MSKISRNAPCPCGSGKKYQHCCLSLPKETKPALNLKLNYPHISKPQSMTDSDDLDNLSNQVVDLIKSGKLEEAQKACLKLMSLYPDQIDGIERMAQLYEAKGDKKNAAAYYKKSASFAQRMPGFDQEAIDWYLTKANNLE